MILAEKITEERKKNGWSQEELADKLGVSRQAVSKWESAGSIPELQKIIQLAALFNVSTDYLLKDEIEHSNFLSTEVEAGDTPPLRRVSMEEANSFLDMKRKSAPVIANATFMCIVSPALLILLLGMADSRVGQVTEQLAAGVGLVSLFGLIAAAVFMFITCGMRESHMEHLEKDTFETEYGVSGMVKEKRRFYEGTYTRGIAIGVVLCILAVVPLILAAIAEVPDYIICAFVSLLLFLVAIGVNIIIRVSTIRGSYDTLLQEGEFSREEKYAKRKLDAFSGAYWCLVTAVYLGWSFWTMRWDFTWIVWPVAGVLFAAVSTILRAVIGTEKNA